MPAASGCGSTCSVSFVNLAPMPTETQTAQLWICTSCGFVYDPEEGDPDGGIPPGTPFESIPDDWFCPVCGARKADFEPYEE
jgi:rubredoxin